MCIRDRSEAMKKAWAEIERNSGSGSEHVKKSIKGIGNQAKQTTKEISSGLGSALKKIGAEMCIRDRGFSNLTQFQQDIIREVVCQQADFEAENADEINTILQGYSINGVSAQFGSSWNVFTDKGIAMKRDTYSLLCQTGLCCRLAR